MRLVKELRDEIATRPVYDPLQEADERLFLLGWATRRMIQALDAHWLHYDGLPKGRYPRSLSDAENWWTRFEKYRKIVESCLGS